MVSSLPYIESSRHLGASLPANDRLRSLYDREAGAFPQWIAALDAGGCGGINAPDRRGFYGWGEAGRGGPTQVHDPATGTYVPIGEISRKEFWSYYEARERDRRSGRIKSAESAVRVAGADDAGGRAFRRYVLPICLYALDMIQDGVATPGQINISTRAGLRFKAGLIELIDALIAHLTIDGLLELIHRARDESADDPHMVDMLDTDGASGPRAGTPCLLHELKKRNISRLLGYGEHYGTPVAELDLATGSYRGSYLDLKFVEPDIARPRREHRLQLPVCAATCSTGRSSTSSGTPIGRTLRTCTGRAGAAPSSSRRPARDMRMLGADAREFNRGWFERDRGYVPLHRSRGRRFQPQRRRALSAHPEEPGGVDRRVRREVGRRRGVHATFSTCATTCGQHGFVYDSLRAHRVAAEEPPTTSRNSTTPSCPASAPPGELKRLGPGRLDHLRALRPGVDR